jgi:hypothetical protein
VLSTGRWSRPFRGGVGEAAVRDAGFAAQGLRGVAVVGLESLVDLGVDAGDEKRCHRRDLADVVAIGGGLLEAVEIGIHDQFVALNREDQGDVDADALGQGADRWLSRLAPSA